MRRRSSAASGRGGMPASIAERLAMGRLVRSWASVMIAQFGIIIERFRTISACPHWHLDAAKRS
ncbi:hypothetical protein SAE02_06610 [Skermanella aerolata]|uniref:Uncharacterized protein n=1 Tax=Skermanella aerolata TaxID=393310 RepID=A0A512DJ49_9PROT|nr:hypothetical protein SAE02_06610 [Skermanella aerolata]